MMKQRIHADGKKARSLSLYDRVRKILDSARTTVARSVNTTQGAANWLIGREIIEEEQLACRHRLNW